MHRFAHAQRQLVSRVGLDHCGVDSTITNSSAYPLRDFGQYPPVPALRLGSFGWGTYDRAYLTFVLPDLCGSIRVIAHLRLHQRLRGNDAVSDDEYSAVLCSGPYHNKVPEHIPYTTRVYYLTRPLTLRRYCHAKFPARSVVTIPDRDHAGHTATPSS